VSTEKTPDTEPDEQEEELAEGSLMSHLAELRNRLIKAFAAVFGVFVLFVPFSRKLFDAAAGPLVSVLPEGRMQAISVMSPLLATLKLSFLAALMVAMPVVLYQTWAFVAPGLYKKEKRFAFPMLASSIFLFYAGAAFAYFVVFPLMFTFITTFAGNTDSIAYQPDISEYISFITMVVLAFGVAFEVPIATVLLVSTGLISIDKLKKSRPYVFLLAFVVGMFLTPPDVISQTLLAVPVYLLYEIGIIMSGIFGVRGTREDDAVTTDS
jgi:sec-independent protein translocase protein TatC